MTSPNQLFDDRVSEIEEYFLFLQMLEEQTRFGPPKFANVDTPISMTQQRMLYSSVYLQLYNLVESTILSCIEKITSATTNGVWKPGDLSEALLQEWVRATARTHIELTPEHRLNCALELCRSLVAALPISEFAIERSGGSWDDVAIERITNRLGFALQISPDIYSNVKKSFRNDKGPLAVVKELRNSLAHGGISFSECSEGTTVAELIDLKERTINYLREVVNSFITFVERQEFLQPHLRPAANT